MTDNRHKTGCDGDHYEDEPCNNYMAEEQPPLSAMEESHQLPVKWGDAQQYHQDTEFPTTSDMDEAGDGTIVPRVTLLSMTPEPLRAVAAMCAMYEGRVVRDLSEMDDDYVRAKWDDVLATHLNTPLEAVQLHFLIEGVDRAFTHQLVRQRVGAAYAQESLRFAVVDDLKSATTLPPSLAGTVPGTPLGAEPDHAHWQRNVWDEAIDHINQAYLHLVNSGMPAEEARGLLPHCTATRVHYVTNLRALSDHAGNRLCTQAQFHWKVVFAQIIDAIRNYGYGTPVKLKVGDDPNGKLTVMSTDYWQYEAIVDSALFRPVCFKQGKCPFKAGFDRACSIRERVDTFARNGIPSDQWQDPDLEGELSINPAEWLANPGAARA